METVLTYIAALLTLIIVLPFYRVVKGPTVFDRLLGAGAVGTKILVIICLVGFIFNRIDMFIDITLAYAILNFIGTIAIAKYFESPEAKHD